MLVERVNHLLDKGLHVMTNEQESVRVAMENTWILYYAWISDPIPDTDLSHSLVDVGPELLFVIDFNAAKHIELTSSQATIKTYTITQAELLKAESTPWCGCSPLGGAPRAS